MSRKQILAREQRWAVPAAVAPVVALGLMIVATVITQGNQPEVDNLVSFLRNYEENSGPLLIAAIVQAVSLALLAPPLFNLFRATGARREDFRHSLVGLTIAGPILLAIGIIAVWAGFKEAADTFVTSAGQGADPSGVRAEDARDEASVLIIGQALAFAGALATGIGMTYTGMNSQRVGLMTRFWGTLGAALGVFMVFLGLIGAIYLVLPSLVGIATYIWFVVAGMVAAGWWVGQQPPAWEAGEAVPWPTPGEQAESEGIDPEEPGLPADVDPEADEPPAGSAGNGAGPQARRKRKRRG